jgi:hypothetical protein
MKVAGTHRGVCPDEQEFSGVTDQEHILMHMRFCDATHNLAGLRMSWKDLAKV